MTYIIFKKMSSWKTLMHKNAIKIVWGVKSVVLLPKIQALFGEKNLGAFFGAFWLIWGASWFKHLSHHCSSNFYIYFNKNRIESWTSIFFPQKSLKEVPQIIKLIKMWTAICLQNNDKASFWKTHHHPSSNYDESRTKFNEWLP